MKRKAYVTAPGSATVRWESFMRAGTGQRGIKVYNFRGNVTFIVMPFIWSLRTVEEGSVCSPSPPDRAGTGTCQQLEGFTQFPLLLQFVGKWSFDLSILSHCLLNGHSADGAESSSACAGRL